MVWYWIAVALYGPLLLATALVVVMIMREIKWMFDVDSAMRAPPQAPCRVAPFPATVASFFFPGNGADSRQASRALGTYPNAATLLHNPVNLYELCQPSDIYAGRFLLYPVLNIGQERDVTHALKNVRVALAANPAQRLVLFGTSRGAAVALQVAARLTTEEIARIPVLICEAPFTTVEDVIDRRFAQSSWLRWFVRTTLSYFTEYRQHKNGVWSPLAAARHFPHAKLPIVLVSSRADTIVHQELVDTLAQTLRQDAKVVDLTEIRLAHSSHSGYTSEDAQDRALYVKQLESVYARVF